MILVIALLLVACDTATDSSSTPTPSPTPTTPKTTQEIVVDYLLSLGDNFSVSAKVAQSDKEYLAGKYHRYELKMDGNKLFASVDNDTYYLEQGEENVYIYELAEGQWRKSVVEDEKYPTNVVELFDQLVSEVDWSKYDSRDNTVTGHTVVDGKRLQLECSLADGTIAIYNLKKIIGSWYVSVLIGNVEIHSIGSTTVTLPADVIDTVAPDTETE